MSPNLVAILNKKSGEDGKNWPFFMFERSNNTYISSLLHFIHKLDFFR